MALNTYTDVSAFVNTVFEDALFVARDNNLMIPLVTSFMDKRSMADRKNQEYGTAIMNEVAETDDLVSQSFTPSALSTLTPKEYAGNFFLTDQRIDSDPFGARNDASLELGLAAAQDIEIQLVSNFSSFTAGTIGAAGTVMTWGHFYAMLSVLRNEKAPLPYAFVCHPFQWHELGKAATHAGGTATNAPNFQDEVVKTFWVRTVGPVDIFISSNITIDGSDDAYSGMFSRAAIAYDSRRAPRLEPARNATRRGWDLVMSMIYGHGTWRPKYGVTGLFDCKTPTT